MRTLPDEILELIVRHNNDSIRTLISWALISPRIRNLVSKEIGIITIQDGSISQFQNILDFQCLISENNIHYDNNEALVSNHIHIISDDIDDEYIMNEQQSFSHFISHFNNLLIVIETTRPYSENLSNTLTRVANSCHYGINICVFYKTHTNFLSKLYFKSFKNILPHISLTELYIFGDTTFQSVSQESLIDIDTLFQTVYIQDLNTIYSLDIIDDTTRFYAPRLVSIKKINYKDSTNIAHFLRHCTNIQNIDYLKFPVPRISNGKSTTFVLPSCRNITLNEFSNDVSYPIIDGSKISKALTLKPTLRSTDPIFKNLWFPEITCLQLSISDFKIVKLIDCDFNQVRNLDVGGCLIPWDSLNLHNKSGEKFIELNIKIRFNDWQQLSWLNLCPYHIRNLEIISNTIHNFPIDLSSNRLFYSNLLIINGNMDITNLNNFDKFENISFNVNSLEQCRFLQELISTTKTTGSNNKFSSSSFKITIEENSLQKSIIMNKNNKLIHPFDLPVSTLKHLTLLLLQNDDDLSETNPLIINKESAVEYSMGYFNFHSFNKRHNSLSIPNEKLYTSMFNIEKVTPVDTISPSQFRKNSLVGLSSSQARRQSIITFDLSSSRILDTASNRRRSSLDSCSLFSHWHYLYDNEYAIDDDSSDHQDFICFKLQGSQYPNIITLNINILESSLLKFDDFPKDAKVPLLQIWFTLNTPISTYEQLIISLTNRIIDLLNYPYDQITHLVPFQKLQLFVDFSESKEDIYSLLTFEKLMGDLTQFLSMKGHSMKFVQFTSSVEELVVNSPSFSVCIKL